MARLIGGVVIGTAAAIAVMVLIQRIGHLIWPLPADLGLYDPEAAARAFADIPLSAKLVLVFAWFAGGLVGAAVAGALSGRPGPGWVVAGLAACLGIVTVLMVPQPVWMQVSAVGAPLLGGLAAHHLPTARRSGRGGAAA